MKGRLIPRSFYSVTSVCTCAGRTRLTGIGVGLLLLLFSWERGKSLITPISHFMCILSVIRS